MFWEQDLTELFRRGGPVMWPLLACSILGLALIIERTLILLWISARFGPLSEKLKKPILKGNIPEAEEMLRRSRSPIARVAAAYLQHVNSSRELREDVVRREASQQIAFLERRLNWLGMLGHVAPLLGLLGTVLGLIAVFHQMDLKGSQLQTSDLAVGIWQKLLNTAFGMVIAIPCLVAYYWLDGRISVITSQMEWITSYLNEWTHAAGVNAGETPAAVREAPLVNGEGPAPAPTNAPATPRESTKTKK
jgi:biopolymer transport protein ExbB